MSEDTETARLLADFQIGRQVAAITRSGRYALARLDNFMPSTPKQAKALALAHRFIDAIPWITNDEGGPIQLWLLGKPGLGKTHLAVAVIRQAVAMDSEYGDVFEHRFVSYVELMREWRASSKRGGDEAAFFKRYTQRGILVLDDVKSPRDNDEAEAFDWLVELRYRQTCCPVVLTANLNQTDLRAALGERSFDRLREGALLAVLDGASHRARFDWDGPPKAAEEGHAQ